MAIILKIKQKKKATAPPLYTLIAEPRMRPKGPLQGYLDWLVFTAQSRKSMYVWYALNTGNLVTDFGSLLPLEQALEILHELHRGNTVTVPGRYRLDQLQGRFGFTTRERTDIT
jgi:hypothetical protein